MPHVVELHGLTRAVTTADLELFLLDYQYGGVAPSVRWVDDHHALAVFSCKEGADALLESGQRQYGVRPWSQASAMAHEHPPEGGSRGGGGWGMCGSGGLREEWAQSARVSKCE
jgi:hypothetical protein